MSTWRRTLVAKGAPASRYDEATLSSSTPISTALRIFASRTETELPRISICSGISEFHIPLLPAVKETWSLSAVGKANAKPAAARSRRVDAIGLPTRSWRTVNVTVVALITADLHRRANSPRLYH